MIRLLHPYMLFAALPVLAWIAYSILHHRSRPVLRGITLLLLVFALAAPRIAQQRAQHSVVFLVDRSASVTLTSDDSATRDAVQRIVSEHPDWSFASVEFAETAALTAPLDSSVFPIGVIPFPGAASNLDAAVGLGLSILPGGGANHLILISDGLFTDDPDIALTAARLAGVSISTLPVGDSPRADVAMVSMHGPTRVPVDRVFSIDIEIESAQPTPANLVVYRDDDLLSFEEILLREGVTRVSIEDSFAEPVTHTYQAIIKALDDPIANNDTLSILVEASDQPSILIVDRLGESAIPALLETLDHTYVRSGTIPSLEVLSGYRQLILTGLSLATLTPAELDAIGSFVRDLGGGLFVAEGSEEVRGIGEGGIEELLPVSYTLPEKSREAQLALVYVLDRSSSMRSRVKGVEKIEILKESTAASAALLSATTSVGILTFNLDHVWSVPIAPVESAVIYDALHELEAVGGTDIYYPIVEALDQLEEIDVPAKHILLVSDGKTVEEPRDYAGLIRRLQQLENVTLSAIGVGRTMNVSLLSALVEAGGGTLYRADDFSLLPQISIQATQRISRQRFVDGPAEVDGRLLSLLGDTAPPLDAYVLTYAKPGSDTSLWVGEDPIVSTWRAGLGAVTVLNTDLSGFGSKAWLAWPGLSGLLEAILATTEPVEASTRGLSASITRDADAIELIVDARDDAGGFANFLDVKAELLPEGTTYELPQMGPGLYASSLPVLSQGGYALHVVDHTRQRSLTLPWTVPYPIEYRQFGFDRPTLLCIAEATGGTLLENDTPLPAVRGQTTTTHSPLHPTLLLTALGIFLLDLLARRWPSRGRRKRHLRSEGASQSVSGSSD